MKNELISVTLAGDFKEYMVNGRKIGIGIISGESLTCMEGKIPNTPNTREFMGPKNKYVAAMKRTLIYHPELFLYFNNGVHIIAESSVNNDDGTTTIYFKSGQGIFNGVHTMSVLQEHGRKNNHVLIAIYFGVPEGEMIDIIIGKNSSTPMQEISRGEKLERYEWIKRILPDYPIRYKESDKHDLDVGTILHIAGIFQANEKSYKFINKDYRKFRSYLRNKGGIVKKHNDGKLNLEKTQYILKDIVDLYLFIRKDEECKALIKRNLEGIGWIRKGVITDSLMFNILNALNFTFYISKRTLYPCSLQKYDVNKSKALVKSSFPKIVDLLKNYEQEGLRVSEICRENNIYQEIQNIMLVTELEANYEINLA
ncbi:hypothetical protein GLW20_08595 [Virgibacillus halodenitrificans]|nr:hypothetical protein [Virgibacillus halodenitrificans]